VKTESAPPISSAADVVSLRAASSGDEAFLQAVYAGTRAQELALTNWTDDQKAAFCRSQFAAQDTHYRQYYPNSVFSVILRDGTPVGRLYVDQLEREIRIMDISLLPEHRGFGIGTRLLMEMQSAAAAGGKTLTIHVEKFNPALRLYQRLGFCPKQDEGIYLLMEWRATAAEPLEPVGETGASS
jgi:ribosomal protein S18 acetylase RimI-like enzyme